MHNTSLNNKEKLQYLERKEQLNNGFVWSEENIKHIVELNKDLSKLQIQLVKKIRSAYDLFSKLEKSGMSFFHGFKVIGNISFTKEIVNELYCLDDLSEEQKAIIKKWENLEYYSQHEINSWQLIFDSEIKDFMPLSKIRICDKRRIWDMKNPKLNKLEFCNYLAHFLDYNSSFSNADLIECTGKDFYIEVKVVLNHNVSELCAFSKYHPSRYFEFDLNRSMLEDRQYALDKAFDWNKTNIQKIMDVNSWIWKKTEELKTYMTELNAAFHQFSETDPQFANYLIEGQIEYHGSVPNDIATMELQKSMSYLANFEEWNLELDETRQEIRDEIHKDETLNWNTEVYRQHLNEEQRKVNFHYLMHTLFVDGDIYSFEDLVRMREEDFKVCMIIEWSKE